ncbi:nuclear transport factor 2 family protein [Bisgaard Taxon 10/6]|uniref:nuclear transport factor 2 family protein n=1 Tax=Exercitatus varius TaxID=67857 RepID=UPI00294B5595|nr:nuclear transport factor 2 family protein [Exercitatus varius]MDG2954807.1 nuclear transport factor 2 family protein [Exercitatus varius]
MNIQQLIERQALKDLVDTFSNLADEKRVAEQMALFTEDAQVNTYIGGQLFAEAKGKAEIEHVFSTYLAQFHSVYHSNGQHTVTFRSETEADAINYCAVKLVGEQDGKQVLHDHSVRYQDSYIKQDGKWLISKRIANFMISESREIKSQNA